MPGGDAVRMRVTFATDDDVKWVGHLDLHRTWERAIRRAQLPLAYSQGFNPQPRLQFAAALPVGFTGEAEMVDVYLKEAVSAEAFLSRLAEALPGGIRLLAAAPVEADLPSLQSQLQAATYRVEVETGEPPGALRQRLDAFLARAEAVRERRKGTEVTRYDLRPLVLAVRCLGSAAGGEAFEVTMSAAPGATGRPDELLSELGWPAARRRIARTALHLAGLP